MCSSLHIHPTSDRSQARLGLHWDRKIKFSFIYIVKDLQDRSAPCGPLWSECWPAATKHEQTLHTMEMRMLRWCLGLTRWDHVMNTDIRKQLGIAPITEKMQGARLQWYGHVVRSDKNSVARIVLPLRPATKGQTKKATDELSQRRGEEDRHQPERRPLSCWMEAALQKSEPRGKNARGKKFHLYSKSYESQKPQQSNVSPTPMSKHLATVGRKNYF